MSTAKKTSLTTPQAHTGRRTFSKIPAAMELPNLISVQKESFERFMGEGLAESFADSVPRSICWNWYGGPRSSGLW